MDKFGEENLQTLVKKPLSTTTGSLSYIKNFNWKPNELLEELKKHVIGQDTATRIIATKICSHFSALKTKLLSGHLQNESLDKLKPNMMLIGPTGSGKTYTIKVLARILGIPFATDNATRITNAGYIGGKVEDVIISLVNHSRDEYGEIDLIKARYGIVFLDEADKIASTINQNYLNVGGRGVQNALLPIIEGTKIKLNIPLKEKGEKKEKAEGVQQPNVKTIEFDTSNILFVFSGAFVGLSDIIRKRKKHSQIGFSDSRDFFISDFDILDDVSAEDLIAFGFIPEFIGRIPVRVSTRKLEVDQLIHILKKPDCQLVKNLRYALASHQINVYLKDDALELIAERACEEQSGARGLSSTFDKLLIDFEQNLPDLPLAEGCVLDFCISREMLDGSIDIIDFLDRLGDSVASRIDRLIDEVIPREYSHGSIDDLCREIHDNYGIQLVYAPAIQAKVRELANERELSEYKIFRLIIEENISAIESIAHGNIDTIFFFLENEIYKAKVFQKNNLLPQKLKSG